MRLVDIGHKHPPFDVASGLAAALLATGTVEVYVAPIFNVGGVEATKAGKHITHFQVQVGRIVEDFQYPPFLRYSCSDCGSGTIEGPNAHKQKIHHQPPKPFAQEVPGDVAVAFIAMRKAYDKRKKA